MATIKYGEKKGVSKLGNWVLFYMRLNSIFAMKRRKESEKWDTETEESSHWEWNHGWIGDF